MRDIPEHCEEFSWLLKSLFTLHVNYSLITFRQIEEGIQWYITLLKKGCSFFGVSTFIKVAHLVDTLYILTILEADQVWLIQKLP